MKRRRLWWLAGAAGVVAAVALLMLPALGEGPVLGEVGVLHLQMDSGGDKFVYNPADSDDNLVQTLAATNCKLASSGDSLVQVVGSGSFPIKKPFAGLRDHRLGVVQFLEHSDLCARIDGIIGQKLTVGLTGSLAESDIGYAEIDLGFKHNGSAILELRDGGPSGAVVGTVTVTCNSAANCGPDSKGDNNRRVILWINPEDNPGTGLWQSTQVTGVFDTIVIKPGSSSIKSSISLEAGFHGSPRGPLGQALNTNDTLLRLVQPFDGEIACEDTANLEGENVTLDITRGVNTDGTCAKAPAVFFDFESGVEDGELFVDFIVPPVEGPPGVMTQFLEVITWTFPDPPNVDAPDLQPQHRTLSYDDHLIPDVENKRVMPWCLGDPRDEVTNELPTEAVDPDDYLPPTHTSCLIESDSHVTIGGSFVTVDVVYNVGDGKRWK